MTLSFNEFTMPMIDFSVSLTTDKKVMLAGPITWADDDYRAKTQATNEQIKWYKEKYGELEILKEEKDKIKESQLDWKKIKAVIKNTQDAFRSGIFAMKIDQELNPVWAKIINPQRGVVNHVLKSTTDNGAIVAGEYETTVIKSILLDSITYYKDGFLAKIDGSGNLKDNKNWLINYTGNIITELMTPYSVVNNLSAQIEPYSIKLTNRKPEFSLYKKSKIISYSPFVNASATLLPVLPSIFAYDTPLQNSTSTSVTARTWPQINYERAVPAELTNDKSRTIYNELLPILNQRYDNQVKLTDNMGGAMLSYIFGRVIVKDDLAAVKNSLESIGYKTQDETTNQLTMYKPGYFLVMTFSVNNLNKAFLNVTY
jgi:hypothetical protein